MYDSGAEALEDFEIKEIPKVKISSEHLKNSLQCSVCLDYFKVNEEAKVLPCNHHFHEGCIDPWLELRGTCPDCRRNLVHDFGNDENGEADNDEETLSGYESAHSNMMIPSYASLVSYDRFPENDGVVRVVESVNGNVYYEDIDDDEDEEQVPSVLGSTTVLRGLLEQCTSRVGELLVGVNDSQNNLTASFSDDVTVTTRSPVTSPLWVSDDESEFRFPMAPGSRDVTAGDFTINDTTIDDTTMDDGTVGDTTAPSSPSIITVSEATSDDDLEIDSENWRTGRGSPFEHCVLSVSSDSSSDRMSIDSESIEEISIASTSEISMLDDY